MNVIFFEWPYFHLKYTSMLSPFLHQHSGVPCAEMYRCVYCPIKPRHAQLVGCKIPL